MAKAFFILLTGKMQYDIHGKHLFNTYNVPGTLLHTLYIHSLFKFSQWVSEMDFFLIFLCRRCQRGLSDFHRWLTLGHTPIYMTIELRASPTAQFLIVHLLRLPCSQALCPRMLYQSVTDICSSFFIASVINYHHLSGLQQRESLLSQVQCGSHLAQIKVSPGPSSSLEAAGEESVSCLFRLLEAAHSLWLLATSSVFKPATTGQTFSQHTPSTSSSASFVCFSGPS